MQNDTVAMETVWNFLKKLKIDLPHDPAISLLGIYPKDKKLESQRAICTPMFIENCSQQPRCRNYLSVHGQKSG